MLSKKKLMRAGAKMAFQILAEKINKEAMNQKNLTKALLISAIDEWGTGFIINSVKDNIPFDVSIARYAIRIGIIYGVYMFYKQKPDIQSIIVHVASLEAPTKFGLT